MKFRIEQRFAADVDAVARAYADPALYASFGDGLKLAAPEVLAHEVDGEVVRLQIRYRFIGELSSAAKAILDPARLTWVEQSTHDLAAGSTVFRLQPDHYQDRMRCEGRIAIAADGDGACARRGEGDLRVKAPLVGGTVERTLVGDLTAYLHDEIVQVEAFLGRPSTG